MIGDLSRGWDGAWIGLRTRWRGLALPVFASPLLPGRSFAGIGGDEGRIVTGSALGFLRQPAGGAHPPPGPPGRCQLRRLG